MGAKILTESASFLATVGYWPLNKGSWTTQLTTIQARTFKDAYGLIMQEINQDNELFPGMENELVGLTRLDVWRKV